ncbi:MAG: sel1 repeat family protein [Lentisphaerae bacterium]|nr:sel1 repeat family protein [Lentisphaerota bacterium]
MRQFFSTSLIITAAIFAAVSLLADDRLLLAARQGDAVSQLALGGEFFYGKNRKANIALALYWFRKAADNGLPEAQYNFGLCLLKGWGCEKNPAAAFRYLQKAVDKQVDKAAVHYAELLFSGVDGGSFGDELLAPVPPDKEKALEILRKASAGENVPAMLLLARYLFMDAPKHGKELYEMLKIYTAKSPDPDPEALVIYAACIRSGIGGNIPDPAEGVKILQRAAEKKHPEAMAQLAEMIFNGFGTVADKELAVKLCNQAIELDSSRAMTDMGQLKLAGFHTAHDPDGAFILFRRAAEKNYPPAIRKLGDCYAMGIGTAKNHPEAMRCYHRAAESGDSQAMFRLGECYRDGEYTQADPAAAFHFFQLAARAGHPGGLRETGKALLDGKGIKADFAQGLELLRRAAGAGDSQAASLLRTME